MCPDAGEAFAGRRVRTSGSRREDRLASFLSEIHAAPALARDPDLTAGELIAAAYRLTEVSRDGHVTTLPGPER
ncbi:hypothetical protein EV562_103344 [Streptomyces sp. BK208]|nr:hypothetical protein EV562_103344 [Streptomyces sp. BK208]